MFDLATRAHNHNYRLDPIVRSLMDTDFYKLLMLQFVWMRWLGGTPVSFGLKNRTTSVRIAEEIDEAELREQLDHVRTLRFTKSELIWLQGNTFYGQRGMFNSEFIEWLGTLQLPEYELAKTDDGQYRLTFSGPWANVMLWEIPALSVINELRSRSALRKLSRLELDILYAQAKTKLWNKVHRLKAAGVENISDFGTRRRHGFLWQEWCVEAISDALGSAFSGTSNAYLAMKLGLEAIGTNAHELPMVLAALARTDEDLAKAPYRVLELWQQTYDGALKIFLPDTYGTTGFLQNAPDWVADWTGVRIDSKDPYEGGVEMLSWWKSRGQDARTKRILFSDGLDVDPIIELHGQFRDHARVGFGWGTLLTNDFRGCHPHGDEAAFKPISLVCKVTEADGRPAVKLSDNITKAMGPAQEIERYVRVFGRAGAGQHDVVV